MLHAILEKDGSHFDVKEVVYGAFNRGDSGELITWLSLHDV